MKKYSGSIAGAVILLSVTSVLSRGIGFIREVIFANTFGLNREFEIYLVAAVLPVLINSAVYYLAQNYFIPLYNKLTDVQEKQFFLKIQFWFFFLLGLSLSAILYFSRNLILSLYIGSGSDDLYQTATRVFVLYILSIPINASYAILAAYLQAELKFRHPAASQLLLNVPIIALVLLFHNTLLILAIPIGYLAGSLMQLLYLVIVVGPRLLSFNLRKSGWDLKSGLSKTLMIVTVIEIVNQLHPFIDRYFLNKVETGGIASLNYASVLYNLPVTIFSFAMASVIFPILSKYINSETPEKTDYYYLKSLRIMSAVFIPITLIYFFNGDILISFIYQRGKFNTSDTYMTFIVLKMYSLSLIFYAGYALINKMVFSTGLLKELLFLSMFLIVSKTAMNIIFVKYYAQNGLALSSSLNFILLALGSYYMVSKKIKEGERSIWIKDILILCSMGLAAYYMSSQLCSLIIFTSNMKSILEITVFIILYITSIRFLYSSILKI